MKKKTLCLCCMVILLALLLPHAPATAFEEHQGSITDTMTWEISRGGVLYIRGTGAMPDYGNYYDEKGAYLETAFAPWEQCAHEITDIVIEEGITYIGINAFKCEREVEDYENLETVTFPSTLERVGYDAFASCNDVERVYAPSLLDWCEIDFDAIDSQRKYLGRSSPVWGKTEVYVDGEPLTGEIVFPTELTEVRGMTFYMQADITRVILHDGITAIGGASFYGTDLQKTEFPEGIESIGFYAYGGCAALMEVNLPAAVKRVEAFAFSGCDALCAVHITDLDAYCRIRFEIPTVYVPGDPTGASPLYYAKHLYLNGELVTEVVVPDDVYDLSDHLFAGCKSLQKVTLPEGLVVIGEEAFAGCVSLKEIRLPKNVRMIQAWAFEGCELETVYLESPLLIGMKDLWETGCEHETECFHIIDGIEENEPLFGEEDWGLLARRILIPDSYGAEDVGLVFEQYQYTETKDGYAVFEGCEHDWVLTKTSTYNCYYERMCTVCGQEERNLDLHQNTKWVIALEPTYQSNGRKELHCNDCGDVIENELIPKSEQPPEESSTEESSAIEESSTVEESSEQADSSAEESSTAQESSATEESSAVHESSAVTSSAESSAPEDKDGFPVGAVVAIVVLILAGGVAVWFVRKKA